MRLGTYSTGDAEPRAAIITDAGVIDISQATGGELPSVLLAVMQRPSWHADVQAIAGAEPHHSLDDVELYAPIPRPGKILAAAGNYQAHVDEGGGSKVDPTRRTPRIFLKPATAVIGPDDPIVLPDVSDEVDWELELAIVMGKPARNVNARDALSYVGGYTILNDVSARSMSWGVADREVHEWDKFFDWLVGKWLDGFAPTGPYIVTADEIDDPHALSLKLELNGEVVQNSSTATMIFDCSELIAFISRFTTLEPGDMIATGTPAGIGAVKGRFRKDGDVMVGTIGNIGSLRTPVVGR